MRKLCCTDYRSCHFCKQPCKRDLGHAHTAALRQFGCPLNDHIVLPCCRIIFEPCIIVFLKSLGCFSRMFGKPSSCQRAVRCHCNIILCAQLCHFPLFLPEDQIIMTLNGHKLCKPFFFCQSVGFCQLIGKTVGDADVADFPCPDHPV